MDENKKPLTSAQTEETPQKKRKINRKLRYGTASTVLTVVVIVGVVLLNIVANALEHRFPLSLDLTADDTYTLSAESAKAAADIKNEVEVVAFQDEAYFSSPSLGNDSLNTIARQFYEAMRQYTTASGGKVRMRYINYADNPTLVAQYADYDVDEGSILFLSDGRYGVTTLAEMFEYDEQSLMYTGALNVTESKVEQVIATNIRKVSGELAPVVMLVGHAEDKYTVQNVKTVLGNNAYQVLECDLTKTEKISDDAITMVIPAPSTDYSAEEVVKIRDWLQQNGEYSRNLVLFTNYTADCPNLYELVNEEYGIEVTQEMVYETGSYYNSSYAAYGAIADSEFTKEIADKKALSLYTQRLKLHKDNNNELSLYNVPLLTFGSTAQLIDLTDKDVDKAKPYASDAYPVVGAAYAHKQVPSPTTNESVDAFVAVFGSSTFLDATVLSYISNAENEELFVQLFNGVSGSVGATTISSRSMSTTYLTYEDATARWVGIGVFTIALPVISLGIGLAVFLRRRHL